jgi:hypothetical protein
MSGIVVTITVPVPDAEATQGKANELSERIRFFGFSEHKRTAERRRVPFASNVTAEVDESIPGPAPVERGAFK